MAYVAVPNANLAAGKPIRSTDIVQMNDNIIDHEASITALEREYFITDSDIRDHFTNDLTGLSSKWVNTTAGVATSAVISEHKLECDTVAGGGGSANYAHVTAGVNYQRIQRAEEYVAYMNIRCMRTGTANASAVFGWNDNGLVLATAAPVTDVSDFVGLYFVTGTGLVARCANGGAATEYTISVAFTAWHIYRLEFTCSATAGNRKLDIYEDGTLESTITSNFPNAILRPTIGVCDTSPNIVTTETDYVEFGFMTTPTAA